LNGKRMQTGCTETMIFTVAQLVSYLSRFMTLEPGDTLRLGIAGLGEQQQDVLATPVKGTNTR
jgi:2-keto-4-pentenoate hydratase/2-oxohepta-3-ene-1,7-dioic acid hydratase in catechol pathway